MSFTEAMSDVPTMPLVDAMHYGRSHNGGAAVSSTPVTRREGKYGHVARPAQDSLEGNPLFRLARLAAQESPVEVPSRLRAPRSGSTSQRASVVDPIESMQSEGRIGLDPDQDPDPEFGGSSESEWEALMRSIRIRKGPLTTPKLDPSCEPNR